MCKMKEVDPIRLKWTQGGGGGGRGGSPPQNDKSQQIILVKFEMLPN